jgi:hypothetical protein
MFLWACWAASQLPCNTLFWPDSQRGRARSSFPQIATIFPEFRRPSSNSGSRSIEMNLSAYASLELGASFLPSRSHEVVSDTLQLASN